jgi:calcineurin-like phosphoesterase
MKRSCRAGRRTSPTLGMCGPIESVLGMDREIILRRFRTTLPQRFEVANEPGVICGVAIGVERDTGRAISHRAHALWRGSVNSAEESS